MQWEATFTKIIEAEDFFEAVDKIKNMEKDAKDVVGVCPYIEEDYTQ